MSNRQRLDRHLDVDTETETILCRSCDEILCGATENYKLHALCERLPVEEAGPLVNDPADYVDDDLEFRKFYCPGCATQLATELIEVDREPIHEVELNLD